MMAVLQQRGGSRAPAARLREQVWNRHAKTSATTGSGPAVRRRVASSSNTYPASVLVFLSADDDVNAAGVPVTAW